MALEFEDILKVNKNLVELVRNWRNSKQVSQYMYTNHHITKEEHQQWMENLRTSNTARTWIIKFDGKPVGIASLSNIDWKNKITEWGFYISDESTRGRGIGSATLYKLMSYVFDKMNFNKMGTIVLENNHVAMNLYEKFGFKKEGKLKQKLVRDGIYIDVILMGILREEWQNIKEKYRFKTW